MGIPENLPEDADAVLAHIGSDPQAFKELYDTFFPRVYNYFRYRNAEGSLADDLTAITFEQAWLGLRKFRPDSSSFRVWLFTIARDLMDEHLRLQNRQANPNFDEISGQPRKEPLEIRDLGQAELLETLAELEDQPRDLIALKFAAHMTDRQIAILSGLDERDVDLNLFRSLARIRAKLDNETNLDQVPMYEREWSGRISFNIGALLNGTELPEDEEPTQDVYQILKTARRLIRMDFSYESQIRSSLGERLAARPPLRRWYWSKPGGVARLLSPPQMIALAIILIHQ